MADKKDPRQDDEDDDGEDKAKSAKGKSSLKLILLVALGAFLLVGASVASTLYVVSAMTPADEDVLEAEEADADAKKTKKDKKAKKKKGKNKDKDKEKDKDKDEAPATVTYLPLDPPFVVNLDNAPQARFLQVSMEVMSKDPAVIEEVKKHMPAIRNSLVLLLSSQPYAALSTPEGKEQIRGQALAAIQGILKDYTGNPGVDAVYYTGFVMQ